MEIITDKALLRARRKSLSRGGKKLGAVMTMGALHDGHLSLLQAARADCDFVVGTIFVNPRQFDRMEDFAAYPLDLKADKDRFRAAGLDLLFIPSPEAIYPAGYSTTVRVGTMQDCLCAAARPGHMEGVTTVVCKLLNLIQPQRAYFGEKDFQQYKIVDAMVQDLNLPLRAVPVPTVREEDGLALSSRNRRLTPEARKIASCLYQEMHRALRGIRRGMDVCSCLEASKAAILSSGFEKIDYFDLRMEEDLSEVKAVQETQKKVRIFAAAWLSGVRLIDNLPL